MSGCRNGAEHRCRSRTIPRFRHQGGRTGTRLLGIPAAGVVEPCSGPNAPRCRRDRESVEVEIPRSTPIASRSSTRTRSRGSIASPSSSKPRGSRWSARSSSSFALFLSQRESSRTNALTTLPAQLAVVAEQRSQPPGHRAGQTPRFLQENATTSEWPQRLHTRCKQPSSRMPHLRYSSNCELRARAPVSDDRARGEQRLKRRSIGSDRRLPEPRRHRSERSCPP